MTAVLNKKWRMVVDKYFVPPPGGVLNGGPYTPPVVEVPGPDETETITFILIVDEDYLLVHWFDVTEHGDSTTTIKFIEKIVREHNQHLLFTIFVAKYATGCTAQEPPEKCYPWLVGHPCPSCELHQILHPVKIKKVKHLSGEDITRMDLETKAHNERLRAEMITRDPAKQERDDGHK